MNTGIAPTAMEKYTVFATSNREDNKTQIFAQKCSKILEEMKIENSVYYLEQLPNQLSGAKMYDYENSPVSEIVEKYINPVNKLIFVIPEYNGSFPGILKLFIDAVHPRNFKGKKAALIGVSSGRSGNVRGMDHLTAILQYLKVEVYHDKLPFSSIDALLTGDILTHEKSIQLMTNQMLGFKNF